MRYVCAIALALATALSGGAARAEVSRQCSYQVFVKSDRAGIPSVQLPNGVIWAQGVMPSRNWAPPVLVLDVITSSNTSNAPTSSHRERSASRNSGSAVMHPAAPIIGSTRTAAC